MSSYHCIQVEKKNRSLWIRLARPELRNAFNDELIVEFRQALASIRHDREIKALIVAGQGKAFCAGADLSWMKKVIDYDYDHNFKDSLALADLLWDIEALPIPTVARIHGPAVGGGVGLAAVCDFALAADTAWFRLSEVKLGLAPAVISPFLLRRMGDRFCRELFLTGKKITATQAKDIGLVNDVVPTDQLDELISDHLSFLHSSSPNAVAACKQLLRELPHLDKAKIKEFTAKVIADLRISEEGQEGMKAFLEKRKAYWLSD